MSDLIVRPSGRSGITSNIPRNKLVIKPLDVVNMRPNEPTGMTTLFNDPLLELPNYPSAGVGPGQWLYSTQDYPPTQGTDDSPLSEHNCWDILYSTALPGGSEPFIAISQVSITPQTNRTLYQCVVTKYPSGWTNSTNVATKFAYFRCGGSSNHWWGLRGGSGANGNNFVVATQGSGATTEYWGRSDFEIPDDTWARVELLLVNNSPLDTANGTFQLWYSLWNGSSWDSSTEVLFDKQYNAIYTTRIGEVLFSVSGQNTSWQETLWSGTYGGGGASPPSNMTLKLASWYASCK